MRVNAVCPGPTDTRMIRSLDEQSSPATRRAAARVPGEHPLGRYATAEEVANVVLFLCSDLSGNVTGAQYVVDGGRTGTMAASRSFGKA